MAVVELKNIHFQYVVSDQPALNGVSFQVEKGNLCALIGPNSGGKTTICNVIRGFVPQFYEGEFSGEVLIDGESIEGKDIGELAIKIGFVFQNPFTQISGARETVFDEIAFSLENIGIEKKEILARVEQTLDLLHIQELRDKNPFELSGGQRQRIALASVIVMEPDILVIDEPTSQLDPVGTEEVFKIIRLMKEKGKTIILVEHKMNRIAEYADQVVLIQDGQVRLDGNPEEVLADPRLMEYQTRMPEYAKLGWKMNQKQTVFETIPITKAQAKASLEAWMQKKEG